MKNQMELSFLSIAENEAFARMVISAFLVQANPTLSIVSEVRTAISEAVTNAIVHGYAHFQGTVRLHAICREDGLVIVDISDKGCGIADVDRARQPFYTTAEGEERSGMGFTVMESFMDRVEVQSAVGHGTTVRLAKQLNVREDSFARRA